MAAEASGLRSLLSDVPQLASAGRSHQAYMLRDKIRRRGFSDKTAKDYLSFGGACRDSLSRRISRAGRGKKGNDSDGKMMEGKEGE